NQYNDTMRVTITNLPNQLVTTSTFTLAGELQSVVTTGPGITAGTTTYKYDPDNRLLMVIDPTNVRTFNVYDEAGRKTGEVDGDGTLTEFVYNAASEVIKTIRYATAVDTTKLANSAGAPLNPLISAIRPAATANDQVNRAVFNNAGQRVFTIDAAGDATETRYDGAGRVTDTIGYATAIAPPIPANVGELRIGATTTTSTQLVDPSNSSNIYTITADSGGNDRRTRLFYNNDGQLQGSLDAAGYFSENSFDAAGRLIQTTRYANPTNVTDRTSGSFTTLHNWAVAHPDTTPAYDANGTATGDDEEMDASTYFFYDGEGRQIGVLDAEGYFTETQFDVAGNIAQQLKCNQKVTYSSNFQTVQSAARAVPSGSTPPVQVHSVSYAYDGAGRVTTEMALSGTTGDLNATAPNLGLKTDVVTSYQYDNANNVISTTRAVGSVDALGNQEARTTQARYDALGHVTQTLSGEGSKALAALTNPTQAQIDGIWNQYGVKNTYDVAGRLTSTTAQAIDPTGVNPTQTLTTVFYYDDDGQLRFTVQLVANPVTGAIEGEVSARQYNALDQLTDVITYTKRLTSMGTLQGGRLASAPAALISQLNALADATSDAHTSYTYKITGQVASRTTTLNGTDSAVTTYDYNA
ncbi:MAG TPA: hypothetical protein VET48_06580, partial [Steroidobacteraceae bacterium]|nr:hypothetical protein [Steroidobacteraceae bacterium]